MNSSRMHKHFSSSVQINFLKNITKTLKSILGYLNQTINNFNPFFNLWYEKNKKKAYFEHFSVIKNDDESFTFLATAF